MTNQINMFEQINEGICINKPIRLIELFAGMSIIVSSSGDIFTQNHNTIRKNGRLDNRKGRKIKPFLDCYGYLRCTFSYKGKRKSVYAHTLVALAFIDNTENKPTVNHKNGIKTDNRVENLEWATQSEQKRHAIKNGLCIKNTEALAKCNENRSIPIIYKGVKYPSIKSAARQNKIHEHTAKAHADYIFNKEQ